MFIYDFNLGFGCPRFHTCATRDEYNANETAKEIDEHQQDSILGYRLMAEDCERALSTPGVNYITFDLEKCLPWAKIYDRIGLL